MPAACKAPTAMSLPLRERGLKLFCPTQVGFIRLSLPLRERGLKLG